MDKVISNKCFRETFPQTIANADVSCTTGNITCTVVCRSGHVFPDGTRTQDYTCTGLNSWSPTLPPQSCVPYESPQYQIIFDIVYSTSVPASGCLNSHNASLLANNNSFTTDLNSRCNIPGFLSVGAIVVQETSSTALTLQITTRFTVKISGDGSGDTSSFSTCSNLLTNSQANSNADFLRYSNSIDCGSGTTTTLTKQSTTLDTSGNLCSSSKEKITTSDFGEQCVSCRPGTYVLNGVCTACPDGLYQDVAGRTACKECPSGQVPDDNKAACRAVCPPGFTSSNGVTACTPCDVDEYSVNTTHCESCPSGSSTLNIKAVVNETGCKVFTGMQCETDNIDSCNSTGNTECAPYGMCQDKLGNDYNCLCPTVGKYTGDKCEKDEDLCSPDPCKNDGTCVPFGSVRYQCMCKPGYTGETCQTDLDECTMNPDGCFYNSTCKNMENEYTCTCQYGFSGDHCQKTIDLCDTDGCPNGICYSDYNTFKTVCVCEAPYELDNAGKCTLMDPCEGVNCVNGSCSNGMCNCIAGFTGSQCQHNIDECASMPCGMNGQCMDMVNSYDCQCNSGFTGTNCETNIDDCPGSCDLTNTDRREDRVNECRCICKPGYTGVNCTDTVDECMSYPCQHGATCIDGDNDYTCNCTEGWDGKNCQNVKNYCANSPCSNNGDCYNLFDGRFCRCQGGTRGETCDDAPPLCNIVQPCVNSGVCWDTEGSTKCNCTDNYSGFSCQLIKDHCSSSPCKSTGTCVTEDIGYKCSCNSGYSGDDCGTAADLCSSVTCPSGTTCAQTSITNAVCYCNQGRVLTDSGCKVPDTNYDILFDMMLGNEGAMLRQPIIHTGNDLTIAFWVKAVRGSATSQTSVFHLTTGDPSVAIFSINTTHLIIRDPGDMMTETVSLGTTLDMNDGDWHHIAVLWKNSSSLTLVVDAVTIQDDMAVTMINASLAKVSSIRIGEHFSGRISQVVIWDVLLSITDVFKLYGDRSFTPANPPLQAWTNYRVEKGGRMTYPSTAKNNTICDSPLCLTSKTTLKMERCGDDVSRFGNQRIISLDNRNNAAFSGESNVNSSLPEGDTYTYGSYPEVIVARDTYGNFEVCHFKVYIKYNDECPQRETDGSVTYCQGTSDSICDLTCSGNSVLSRPFPDIKPCTKLGVYDVTMPWNQIEQLPNCGEKDVLKIKITQAMMYQLVISCDSSFYDNFKNSFRSAFVTTQSSPDWGICDSTCGNLVITPLCPTDSSTNLIHITIEITNINNILSVSNVNYSPRDVMRILTFENNLFDFNNIAGATLQTSSVTIEESPSCPDGFVIVGSDCVKCGIGSYLDQSSMSCELCSLGTYQDTAASTSCKNCTSGTTLYMGSVRASDCVESCKPGYKYDKTSMSCQPCDRHYYQHMPNKDYCFPCPVGKKTSEMASNSSTLCYDDCPEGTELKSTGECVDCLKGTYRSFTEDTCQMCNSSYTTDGIGKKSASDCNIIICYNGTYRNTSDSTQCYNCPIGQYQEMDEQTSCDDCGTSYSTVMDGANNRSLCLFYCEPGEEEDTENPTTCRKCARGKYKDASMQFSMCTMCPTGNTTNSTAASSIEECNITICSPGEVIGADGGCMSCPLDTYQPMDVPHLNTECLPCDQGTATNQTGTANKTGCMPYCNAGQQYSGMACEDCPMGTYKIGGDDFKFEQCQMCPENYTTNGTGKTNDTECNILDCPVGSKINGMICELCPQGSYQPNPLQTFCIPCDPKRSTAGVGSVNETECNIDCPAGEEERGASNNCTKCRENFIKPDSGSGLCQECTGNYTANDNRTECNVILCDKGYIADNVTNPSMCMPCAVRFYKVARGNQDDCVKCDAGFTTAAEASTMKSQCDQPYCVPGKFELGGVCTDCPVGYYKSMEGNDNCTACPNNATTSTTGSTSESDCSIVVCEVGEKRNGSTNMCDRCAVGEYSPERGRDSCISCGNDKTTEYMGSDMMSDCVDICAVGRQFNANTKGCDVCPLGYFKDTSDITTSCIKCQTGKTTPNTESTSRSDCSLDDCTAGYYRTSGGCTACPIGEYQDLSSQTSCKSCGADQTTEFNASVSINACFKNCTNGQELLNRTADTCVDCKVGFYKDMSISQFCLKCPSGITNTATGSSSCPIQVPPDFAYFLLVETLFDRVYLSSTCDLDIVVTTLAPVVRRQFTLTVRIRYRLSINCGDPSARSAALVEIRRIVIIRFTTLHSRFPFCLVSNCFSRVTVRMTVCAGVNLSRRKRAIEDTDIDVVIPDVSEDVGDNDRSNVIQSTQRVITEDMETNPTQYSNPAADYTLDSVTSSSSVPECSDGSILVNGACQPCGVGSYHNTDQNTCVPCPLHQYQDVEGQTSCKSCPTTVTKYTQQTGSNSSSHCVSDCVINSDYCNGRGDCREDGISVYCVCINRYSGARCTVFSEPSSDIGYIVGGTVGGIAFLMLIILIVVAFCSYIRKSKKTSKYKQRLADEYDGSMYGGPIPVLDQKPLPGRKGYMKAYNGSSMNRAFQHDDYDNYTPTAVHQSSFYQPKLEDETSEFMWHSSVTYLIFNKNVDICYFTYPHFVDQFAIR
ncbi:hypothetical protein FSP39_017083 [Pinctada imbricata]|uniref:EGF-like domain-containing protein n=1 Tax=Pinctada imbricata TaxID=66713 RepID=A0AA88XRP0_PINIB|nr:hypothetical protein FSP39_017083 [Pinctada imbricata]